MNYCEVNGENISADIELIREKLAENAGIVFLYVGEGAIHDYIYALYNGGKGLDNEALYKFKLCYANKRLDITFLSRTADAWTDGADMDSMKSLIQALDGETPCRIIVNTDSREELSFIVQQLIFIQYPLETVDILLRQEERDADKVRRFQQRVDDLVEQCAASIANLEELARRVESEAPASPSKEDRLTDIQSALDSCKKIQKNLEKSRNLELKLAVAASKKTGKSVIVNCFIGEEVAPTDVQLATPNNCIYQKSPDDKYTLRMEGDGATQSFSSREAIREAIEERFRAAQNDKDHGFALPDMRIGYRSEGNNFSSYTIYDTAGPDAAGTNHEKVALRAMNKCDVAVFAIDYQKYLTDSEEKYLNQIKGIFKSQQKFHSLLFALNKIDVRYNDPRSSKSIVGAVDFIRTRLGALAEEYRDCIIFPTCSLEYFSALEAEDAGVMELYSPTDNVKKVKFAHKDVPALAFLHTHSENLEYYHGIEEFSYDVFKRDSGMPALMSYVSYVATSKARDEIVNHMVFEIEQQKQYLQTILNTVSNLEALIQADEKQIQKIKEILDRYLSGIKRDLTPEITGDDLNALPASSLLQRYKGDVNEAKANADESIQSACRKNVVLESAYNRTVNQMWNKLEPYKGKTIDNAELSKVMNSLVSKEEINSILREWYAERTQRLANDALSEMQKLREEIKRIGGRRQNLVRERSKQAKEELKKEGVDLKLPQLPNFEFDAALPKPDTTGIVIKEIDKGLLSWADLFEEHYSGGQVAAAIFTLGIYLLFDDPKNANTLKVNREQFIQKCNQKFKEHFENILMKSDIAETMQTSLRNALVDGYVDGMIRELTRTFKSMMEVQQASVEQFSRIIDDRDKYKSHIDQQNERKENIRMIQEMTSAFMETWSDVIGADGVKPT